jgi:hypothetical protein
MVGIDANISILSAIVKLKVFLTLSKVKSLYDMIATPINYKKQNTQLLKEIGYP